MDSKNSQIDASLHRARAALRRNDPLAAIAGVRAALSSDPSHAAAHELLGIAQFHGGDSSAARESLIRATDLDPRRASAHFNYAIVLDHFGQVDEAMQEIQTALLIKPDYAQAQELYRSVARRIRERNTYADGGFAIVENRDDPFQAPPAEWAKIECASCSAMNFVTARTCCRCGSLLPEAEEVYPVE